MYCLRELKWDKDKLEDLEWEKEYYIEKKNNLFKKIVNEFKYANLYFKLYTLNIEEFKSSYKKDLINNKYVDVKLLKIIFLPNEIIYKIFNNLYKIL